MEAHRVGLPLAVGIAVAAAGAATFALRPRAELIQPAPVAATDYFSASELDRIHDYTGTQRLLGLGGLALSTGTLAFIALRPPRRVRRALERGAARPILGAAAAGGGGPRGRGCSPRSPAASGWGGLRAHWPRRSPPSSVARDWPLRPASQ